uniref:Uncharacterized protein n=1 Tax=Magallana gigas TaxID=29159 RepID=K1QCM3_MAGGI
MVKIYKEKQGNRCGAVYGRIRTGAPVDWGGPCDIRVDQGLLFVTSMLGLCRYDDVDLIRGVTGGSRQDAFMDKLIDLVCIKDAADDPDNKAMRNPDLDALLGDYTEDDAETPKKKAKDDRVQVSSAQYAARP